MDEELAYRNLPKQSPTLMYTTKEQ